MANPPRNSCHHSLDCTNPPSPDSNDDLDQNYINDWDVEELTILEDELARYASEESIVNRYEKIASDMGYRTARDVALRCRLISKKKSSKRYKDTKESATNDSSGMPLLTCTSHPIDHPNASSSYTNTAGGTLCNASECLVKQLAENVLTLSRLTSNLATNQTQENADLFLQTRANIIRLMDKLNIVPEPMPPLPFKLKEEHASTFIASPDHSSSDSEYSRITSNSRASTSHSDPPRSSSNSREKTATRRKRSARAI